MRLKEPPLTADEARATLFRRARPMAAGHIPLERAVDHVLAEDALAVADFPPFTNSARDGYAVRSSDLAAAPAALPCPGDIPAGGAPLPLPAGACLRIMTGAPLPPGADAVVMREHVDETDPALIRFRRPAATGDWVRHQGEDARRGDLLLPKGALLRPWEVALLAGQGVHAVEAVRKPRTALLSTGAELLQPGERPRPGAVHDVNGPALRAALRRLGLDPVSAAHATDDPKVLSYRIDRALAQADVLVMTGGVSAGDKDHTRPVLESMGFEILFHGVAIRPGGPFLAAGREGQWVLALPGNPLSALVCFEEFVSPLLQVLQGRAPDAPAFPLRGRAVQGFRKPVGLRQYLFVRTEGDALHIPPQGSALLRSAAQADGLALLEAGVEEIQPGAELRYRRLP